jgi:hypothetical protein
MMEYRLISAIGIEQTQTGRGGKCCSDSQIEQPTNDRSMKSSLVQFVLYDAKHKSHHQARSTEPPRFYQHSSQIRQEFPKNYFPDQGKWPQSPIAASKDRPFATVLQESKSI